jgi:hypothetical protein
MNPNRPSTEQQHFMIGFVVRTANIPVIHTCIKGIPELKQFIFDLT